MYNDYDGVKEHSLKDNQQESTYGIMECSECDCAVKSVEVLIMHIATKHNDCKEETTITSRQANKKFNITRRTNNLLVPHNRN